MDGYGLETRLSHDLSCIEFMLWLCVYICVSDSYIDAHTSSLSIACCMCSIAIWTVLNTSKLSDLFSLCLFGLSEGAGWIYAQEEQLKGYTLAFCASPHVVWLDWCLFVAVEGNLHQMQRSVCNSSCRLLALPLPEVFSWLMEGVVSVPVTGVCYWNLSHCTF